MEPTSVYLQLRDTITRVSPLEHGIVPTAELPTVWGVLVDVGLPEGPVTVVAIADGTASLYLGNGSATVGAGALPQVAAAARALLVAVQSVADAIPDGWDIRLPDAGWVQVIALTFAGMRIGVAPISALTGGAHPLGPIWTLAGEAAATMMAVSGGSGAGGTDG